VSETGPTLYPLMRYIDAPAAIEFLKRAGTGWIYVAVPDTDEHCRRAREAGTEILAEPFDTDYGSRDYSARDLEGNQWHFGTYRPAPVDAPAAAA